MSGDILLLIALFHSEHTAWFTLSLLSMLSPFFVCYVPLLTFQKKKLNNKALDASLKNNEGNEKENKNELSLIDSLLTLAFLTPMVLIYL